MRKILGFQRKLGRLVAAGVLGIAAISMNGCDAIYWKEEQSLARVKSQDSITILTTKSPLIYSKPKRGEAFGVDHDLIQQFASYYDLKVNYKVLANEDEVVAALSRGEGDVAAARFRSPDSNKGFLVGPAYEETQLSLFCLKKFRIQNVQDLNGKNLAILNKDDYRGLSNRFLQLAPQATLQTIPYKRVPQLFKDLADKKHDCIIAENFSGDYYLRAHPSVEKVTTLTDAYSLSWLLAPNKGDLLMLMRAWFQKASRDDEIMQILARYRAYVVQLDTMDILRFQKRTKTVLPQYKKTFQQASRRYNLPWQLVASIAYQESHWDSEARSYTGVLGLMQLTTDTALHVGVEDRTDPYQSIWGGTKYMRYLLNKIPSYLNSTDRIALALAAYNVGYAHLLDAQKLAVSMGRNPHSWHHMKEILPLLADPSYAQRLKYGPARGYEAVDFVERVKSFYNLMNSAT